MKLDAPQHLWPEEEPIRVAPVVKPGRLARIGRALGDAFLTAGMSQGMIGDRSAEGYKGDLERDADRRRQA